MRQHRQQGALHDRFIRDIETRFRAERRQLRILQIAPRRRE